MTFEPHNPLWWLDLLLFIGGLCILGIMIARWVRTRRDPLRGSPLRRNSLNPIHVWFCLMVHFLAGSGAYWMAGQMAPAELTKEQLQLWKGVVGYSIGAVAVISACFAVGSIAFPNGLRGFLLGTRKIRSETGYGISASSVALALSGLVLLITEHIIPLLFPEFKPPKHTVFQILDAETTSAFMRAFASFGAFVLAPIAEEALFRGILQTGLIRMMPRGWRSMRHRWLAIIITAVIFGGLHGMTPQHIPALIVLGIVLGFIYERRGALLAPILVHMLFNGKSLLWRELEPYVAALVSL